MVFVRSPDQKTHGERCSTAPASQLIAHELVNNVTWHLSPPTAPAQNMSAHIGRRGMAQRRQQNVNIWKNAGNHDVHPILGNHVDICLLTFNRLRVVE